MSNDEIISNMEQFTQTEMERLNLLAADAVSNPTIEDMKLYARWQVSNELAEQRFKAEISALHEKAVADIEEARKLNDAAIANLQAQVDLAQARLKAVENGQI